MLNLDVVSGVLGLPSKEDISSGIASAQEGLQTAFVIIILELAIVIGIMLIDRRK